MIRDEVSKILGYYIPENRWDELFGQLATGGKMTDKVRDQLLLFLLKHLEQLEYDRARASHTLSKT